MDNKYLEEMNYLLVKDYSEPRREKKWFERN